MKKLSRRNFFYILASLSFSHSLSIVTAFPGDNKPGKNEKFPAKLKKESHDQAVINCMYSWKSHRQHRKKIKEIQKYSKQFFGAVAKKIEGMEFDFYVCEICGSTIDGVLKTPCDICNYPNSHYQKVIRPA